MIDAAVSVYLKGSRLLKEWGKMSKHVMKQSKKRNELARFTMMMHKKKDGTRRLIVMPSILDPKAGMGGSMIQGRIVK